jgi:hypothetical protein
MYIWLFEPAAPLGLPLPERIDPAPGYANTPGTDQEIVDEALELTTPIDAQTWFRGFVGGVDCQPVGGTPVFVVKFQEPPVGVAG